MGKTANADIEETERGRGDERRMELSADRVEGVVGIVEHVCEERREDTWARARIESTDGRVVPVELLVGVSAVYGDLGRDVGLAPGVTE